MTVNGLSVEVPSDATVLHAARQAGFDIPTLCYMKDVNEVGACRVCLVEIEGARTLQTSCVTPVREGMQVKTNTKKVREAIKDTVELILASHNRECLSCYRNGTCELQTLTEELGLEDVVFHGEKKAYKIDDLSPSIVRDSSKCILCGRCVNTCKDVQTIGILEFTNRGHETIIAPAFDKSLKDVPCIYCGQCINVCPVAALREKTDIERVWDAIEDPDTYVIAQTAPAVRAGLGESFGLPIGTRVTGRMVTALKRLGFDNVFDTNFAADLTILEEGTELLTRIKTGGTLPMITSCSPGWIRFCEFYYPEMLDHLSTCKSPHQMFGALLKTYYADKIGIDPKKMFVVSIMPCTSKKSEAARPEMVVDGNRDVDAVLTTRELGKMIKQSRMDFVNLPDSDFDPTLGEYTGAAVIFGATGGVMEAALRTVADVLTGEDLNEIEYHDVRGTEGYKEATVRIGDLDVKAAVVHGTGNARRLLEKIKSGEKSDLHFIEVMGCEGGCVTGGGQPQVSAKVKEMIDVKSERAKALYEEDLIMPQRKSHKNETLMKLYENFLEKPNSHKSHELLHTHYYRRDKYPIDANVCGCDCEENR
nr:MULTISPECIES: NADH-dependent [FeFe] hydrogenase, group A6 [unclassified Fusibacter]